METLSWINGSQLVVVTRCGECFCKERTTTKRSHQIEKEKVALEFYYVIPCRVGGRKMRNKDLQQLIHKAEKQGWIISRTKGSHLKWKPPHGQFVISAYSPSDPRAIKNIVKELRRKGFVS